MSTRALVIHGAKDLRVEEAEVPTLWENEVRVRIRAGGICGSDLHYYEDGGFGTVRIREPMILGHEVAGEVEEVGSGVTRVKVGDRVAVNPSRPCYACPQCQKGLYNHCENMRFYGSAMPLPHIQGAFREHLVVDEGQCFAFDPSMDYSVGAFAEPLSVVLHAAMRLGRLEGRPILVTGCGPIGALAILVAKALDSGPVVATDVADAPLEKARAVGADVAVNVARDPGGLETAARRLGSFAGMFEASGNGMALAGAIEFLQPRSRIVQIGLGGEFPLPVNRLVAKELELCGTFRFHEEFPEAVRWLSTGMVKVEPLLTKCFSIDAAVEAFELAGDRSRAMKVQIAF